MTDFDPIRNGKGISDVYWTIQKDGNKEAESIMKRTLFFFATALFTLTCLVLAGELWENTAYQDWTDKDAEKLLKKSPWSQKVTLTIGGGSRSRGMPSASSGSSRGGGGGGGGRGGGGGGRGGGGGMPPGGEMGEMNFTVRWDSALPIRQAAMRAHYGPEVDTIEEARKVLNTKVSHYAVSLIGFPARMARQDPSRFAALASNAVLKRKKQDPIVAERVSVLPGDPPNGVVFYFPRTDPITLEDKEVEFQLEYGRLKIKRKFKLKKMVYNDKLEL